LLCAKRHNCYSPVKEQGKTLVYRECQAALVYLANSLGGWTIIVTSRKGEILHASKADEKIENPDTSLRISYLYPTDRSIIHSNEWKRLMFVISEEPTTFSEPQFISQSSARVPPLRSSLKRKASPDKNHAAGSQGTRLRE
jgi:hypothetical protein